MEGSCLKDEKVAPMRVFLQQCISSCDSGLLFRTSAFCAIVLGYVQTLQLISVRQAITPNQLPMMLQYDKTYRAIGNIIKCTIHNYSLCVYDNVLEYLVG